MTDSFPEHSLPASREMRLLPLLAPWAGAQLSWSLLPKNAGCNDGIRPPPASMSPRVSVWETIRGRYRCFRHISMAHHQCALEAVMRYKRAHVLLREGLVREIDALAGRRGRSAFLVKNRRRRSSSDPPPAQKMRILLDTTVLLD